MKKHSIAIAAALAATLALAPTALAKGAPSSGGSGSSISLVNESSPGNPASYGQMVTFNVSTSATATPWVKLNCYQGGTWVYTSSAGFYSSYPWGQDFILSGPSWSGGAASCVATLYTGSKSGKEVDLASTPFDVGA
jgi:hypothetical protein